MNLKKSLASVLLCLAIISTGARAGSAQQVQPLEPEWLRQMYAEGWQKVQEGVLQRDTGGGEFETFSYGAEGLQWVVQRYKQQVADLKSQYDASPSEGLAELIDHLEGEILRREGTLNSEPSAESVNGEVLEMCEPSYGGTTFAGPQAGSPGVTASASAYFHDGCGYVGDTFTTAYAQATSATGETILRHSDPKNGGTWLESYSSASVNGSTGCESRADASVTVYYPELSVTYLTPEKLNYSCTPIENGGCGLAPFNGTPVQLAGRIEAEDFDLCGNGLAYADDDPCNNGGVYRTTEDVDISMTTDTGGGYVVGWTRVGEWLKYTVNVASSGTYDISVRVAHQGAGGTFHIEVNGVDVTGPMTVPATGGWDVWTTVTRTRVSLSAGQQVWRLVMDTNGDSTATGNFNWIEAVPTPTTIVLPGTIQAEDYDLGGAGVAYFDGDSGNTGGAYRTDDVDIQPISDNGSGYGIGWTGTGEWLQYTVNVAAAGTYDIMVRVAQKGSGGTFHIEVNGVDVTGSMTIPQTGGWGTWTTITKTGVSLSAGQQVWRLVMDTNGYYNHTGNVNWIKAVPTSTPYHGTPFALPGTIEAEDYDLGGARVAYADSDSGNTGGAYRTDDVDIQPISDNGTGYGIGWTGTGEWLQYTVNVAAAGTYDIRVRVAQKGPGGTFHIEVNGVDVTGPMTVPQTGSWVTWTTITKTGVSLSAGQQVWRLVMDTNGYNNYTGNVNWIAISQ